MQTNIYTLPEISFVGGETQEFVFNVTNRSGEALDVSGMTADFSIGSYTNKTGTPLLSYTPTIRTGDDGIAAVLVVNIPKVDTAGMFGKYIYQITILDVQGRSEIPNQGIMNITRNINQNFVSG